MLDIGARCGGSSWGSPWGGGVGVTTAMTGPDEATCGGGDSTQDGVEVGALWSSLLSPSRDSPHQVDDSTCLTSAYLPFA